MLDLSARPLNASCRRLGNPWIPPSLMDTVRAVNDLRFQITVGMSMYRSQKNYVDLNESDLNVGAEVVDQLVQNRRLYLGTNLLISKNTRLGKRDKLLARKYVLYSDFKPFGWRRISHNGAVLWTGIYPQDSKISYRFESRYKVN